MVKNHLKRIATPKTWSILRKVNTYITRPNPGAHNYTHATSLNTLVKEFLGLANTTKEVKRMLHDDVILVDAKRRHDERFNVGFMDVVSFPKIKKHFRVTLSEKGKLATVEVDEKESTKKVIRISGKKIVKAGKYQLELIDGKTILMDKNNYAVGDSLLIELPSQKIVEHLPLAKGASIIVYEGKYAGTVGVVEEVEENEVLVKSNEKDKTFNTKKAYAYVTGNKKEIIKCSP